MKSTLKHCTLIFLIHLSVVGTAQITFDGIINEFLPGATPPEPTWGTVAPCGKK